MALDWDPTSGRLGLDWPVIAQRGTRLDHSQRAVAAHMPSTVTETVTGVYTYFERLIGTPTVVCDVYDPATPTGALTTVAYVPNEDVAAGISAGTGAINGTPAATPNLFQNIDEAYGTLGDTTYIDFAGAVAGSTMTYGFRVNSAAGLGAGSQAVSSVKVRLAAGVVLSAGATASISVHYTPNGTTFYPMGTTQTYSYPGFIFSGVEFTSTTSPVTGVAWSETEVQAFDSTAWFRVTVTHSTSDFTRLYQADAYVEYRNHPLVASISALVATEGWTAFTFSSSLSKVNGTPWRWVFRRALTSSGSAVIPSLDSGAAMPAGLASYHPTIDSAGTVTAWGDVETPVLPLLMVVGGVAGPDSQPYKALIKSPVDTAHNVVQEITVTGGPTVGWLTVPAAAATAAGPAAALVGEVFVTGGAKQGGSVTFGTELVEDAPLTVRALDGTMASTAALANVQHDVKWTCSAPTGEGWVVSVLDRGSDPISGDARTFGGTTDRGEVDGAESNNIDVATVIGTVPTAPAGFTATPSTSGVGHNVLAWTATALGGSFDRYEIEREEPDGTWRRIATIDTEATATWNDERTRRGASTVENYRIRVRHTNGTVSLPSTADTAANVTTGSYLIVGANSSLSRAVAINMPGVGFSRGRDRVEDARYGNRYVTVTSAPQDRGIVLTGTIDNTGTAGWVAASDWIEALLDADTEITLVNDVGERWIVDVEFGDGTVQFSAGDTGDWQTVAFRAVEVASVPAVVEVA